jgi:hypothetical protein
MRRRETDGQIACAPSWLALPLVCLAIAPVACTYDESRLRAQHSTGGSGGAGESIDAQASTGPRDSAGIGGSSGVGGMGGTSSLSSRKDAGAPDAPGGAVTGGSDTREGSGSGGMDTGGAGGARDAGIEVGLLDAFIPDAPASGGGIEAGGAAGAGGRSMTGGSTSTGGTAGAGGTTSSGGTGSGGTSSRQPEDGVLCAPPTRALITDFTYTPGADPSLVAFGDPTTIWGGGWVTSNSTNYPLTSDVTQNNWHISGTVGDYSQFAIYFQGYGNCNVVDASKYRGISFTISGSIGQNHQLTLNVLTLNDMIAAAWINAHGGSSADIPGRCIPTSGTDQWHEQGCSVPSKRISVTATPTVVNLLWTDFVGGSPEPHVVPSEIFQFDWGLPWDPWGNPENPYPVDFVIDDLSFIP